MLARMSGFGRLLRSRLMWVAAAIVLVANVVIIIPGGESQASPPTALTPRSGGNTVLGTWTPMGQPKGILDDSFQGPGLNQAVYALAEYDGDIYAGGLFDDTGGGGNNEANCSDDATYPLQCIARWDPVTNAWYAVGGGLNNQVDVFLVKDDTLYVGGAFDDTDAGTGVGRCNPPPGIVWTARTAPVNEWKSVTWGGGRFVAVAPSSDASQVMVSTDGSTWTRQNAATDDSWTSVTWGGGRFVAVASAGPNKRAMYSPDGVTWATPAGSVPVNDWRSVAYGGGKFVAVAPSSDASQVMVSTDGSTWTRQNAATDDSWTSVTWGGLAGQEKFVAVASGGDDTRVMYSTDGISWTLPSAPTPRVPVGAWQSVTWGNNLFVAVANADDTRVMISEDGIKWRAARGSFHEDPWTSVTWAGDMFVAVAPGGTQRVMYSTDGVTWSTRTTGTVPNQWQSVARGGIEAAADDTIVIVGSSGTQRVMTSVATPSPGNLRCIAAWNGSSWTPLGGGPNGGVTSLGFLGDDTLIVAGGFSQAGSLGLTPSDELSGLVAWSDDTWVAPGMGGFVNLIHAVLTDGDDTAYFGGDYNGDIDDSGITLSTRPFEPSSSWYQMSTGFSWINPAADPPGPVPGSVDSLSLLNGTVYAGGYFTATGDRSRPLRNLAAWNGTLWNTVGAGLNSDDSTSTSVRALGTDDARGLLYIGGTFDDTHGGSGNGKCDDTNVAVGPLRCVTVWDSGIDEYIPFQWGSDDDSNGLTGEVSSFVVKGKDVYVGGHFNTWPEGGFPQAWNLKNVGKWTWLPPTGSVSASASSGETVSITGTRFIGVPSNGVKFGSTVVPFTRSSTETITATVPSSLASGTYTISVNGVGGWADVGTVAVTQRSGGGGGGGGGTPGSTPTPNPTPSATSSASAAPTPRPTASGPTVEQVRATRQVRPDRVRALANGVPPGKAIVLVDGQAVRKDLTLRPRGMTVRSGPITTTVRSLNGRGVTQRLVDGSLSIPQAGVSTRVRAVPASSIQLTTSGNAALTPMRVFLIPQPKRGPRGVRAVDLGYLMTDAQGRLNGTVALPARRAGDYIVQINGAGSDGRVRSINLPAIVRAPSGRS